MPPAWGDPRLQQQVWANLLENAAKYSSRELQPRVQVEGEVEGGESALHIEDNGVGLAIVHRIVLRHGGRVWARCEPGKGARFSFALLLNPGGPADASAGGTPW